MTTQHADDRVRRSVRCRPLFTRRDLDARGERRVTHSQIVTHWRSPGRGRRVLGFERQFPANGPEIPGSSRWPGQHSSDNAQVSVAEQQPLLEEQGV
jgi:hypothetical protein